MEATDRTRRLRPKSIVAPRTRGRGFPTRGSPGTSGPGSGQPPPPRLRRKLYAEAEAGRYVRASPHVRAWPPRPGLSLRDRPHPTSGPTHVRATAPCVRATPRTGFSARGPVKARPGKR